MAERDRLINRFRDRVQVEASGVPVATDRLGQIESDMRELAAHTHKLTEVHVVHFQAVEKNQVELATRVDRLTSTVEGIALRIGEIQSAIAKKKGGFG